LTVNLDRQRRKPSEGLVKNDQKGEKLGRKGGNRRDQKRSYTKKGKGERDNVKRGPGSRSRQREEKKGKSAKQ